MRIIAQVGAAIATPINRFLRDRHRPVPLGPAEAPVCPRCLTEWPCEWFCTLDKALARGDGR